MSKTDSNIANESPATDSNRGQERPFVHLLTICSILCTVAGVPWALAVTLGHDRTLQAMQVIFTAVGAAGFISGGAALYKKLAQRPIGRLLATASAIISFSVFSTALLVPWHATIERAYAKWSSQYFAGDSTARAELRSEYAALMRQGIREYYLVHSRMPATSDEVTVGNRMFRNPDLLCRASKLEGYNFPSGAECFLDLEVRAFADVYPIPLAKQKDWATAAAKLQEIIDEALGDQDKLRLAVNTDVEFTVAIRHAASLEAAGLVENQQLQDYLESAAEYRRLLLHLPNEMQRELLRHQIISELEQASDSEIAGAATAFEEQVGLVSEILAKSGKGSPNK